MPCHATPSLPFHSPGAVHPFYPRNTQNNSKPTNAPSFLTSSSATSIFQLIMATIDKLKQEEMKRVPSLHSIYNSTSSQHGSHTTLASLDNQHTLFTPNMGLIPKTTARQVNIVGEDYEGQQYDHEDGSDDEDLQLNWQTIVSTDNDVSITGHISK